MTLFRVYRALARFSGVPDGVIDVAPEAVGTPATFGLLLLSATMLSAVTMGYAVYRVAFGSPQAWLTGIIGAAVYWPLVYSIDRLLLNGGTSGPKWAVTLKVAVRILVAVLIGWSISTPVFLGFERNVIDLALYQGNFAEIAREQGVNAQLNAVAERRGAAEDATKEARAAQEALAAGPGASPAYRGAQSERDRVEKAVHAVEAHNVPAIGAARSQLKSLPAGAPESSAIAAQIRALQLELSEAHADLARADADVAREEKAWRDMTMQRVNQTAVDRDARNRQFDTADQKTQTANQQSEDKVNALSTPNLATEWVTAEHIMSDDRNPQAWPMRKAGWLFHSLFVLIELLIVTLKLTLPPSAMDAVVAAMDAEIREKHTLMSNMRTARMHMTEAAIAEVQAQMIEAWKAEQLAHIHHGFTTEAFIAFRNEAERLMHNA